MATEGTANTDVVFIPHDFVYVGARWSEAERELCAAICVIGSDGLLGDEKWYGMTKDWKKRVLGGVYNGATFTYKQVRGHQTATYIHSWPITEDRIGWVSLNSYAESMARTKKMEADAKVVNEIDTIMLPLRKKYDALRKKYDRAGMVALEHAVARALMEAPRARESDD